MINIRSNFYDGVTHWYTKEIESELKKYSLPKGYKGKSADLYDHINDWCINTLNCNFHAVLLMNFSEIKKNIEKIDNKSLMQDEYLVNLLDVYSNFASEKTGVGNRKITAAKLFREAKAGRYTCPYCNSVKLDIREASTGTLSKKTKKKHTDYKECQFDHFYNKSKYPLFALSLYNLIPSCYPCNNKKSTLDISCSPFESNDISALTKFHFYPVDNRASDFDLDVIFYDGMIKNNSTLRLEQKYHNYRSDLNEIMDKIQRMNNRQNIDFMKNIYSGNLQLALESFFDCKLDTCSFYEKELSKMKSDILRKFFYVIDY